MKKPLSIILILILACSTLLTSCTSADIPNANDSDDIEQSEAIEDTEDTESLEDGAVEDDSYLDIEINTDESDTDSNSNSDVETDKASDAEEESSAEDESDSADESESIDETEGESESESEKESDSNVESETETEKESDKETEQETGKEAVPDEDVFESDNENNTETDGSNSTETDSDETQGGSGNAPDNDETQSGDNKDEEETQPTPTVPKDNVPAANDYKGVMHYVTTSGVSKTCEVDFVRDFKLLIEGDNKVYSKELSKMSALFASDVYNNLYITFSAGATGGNDSPTNFASGLGLRDVASYDIKGSDYAYDKDDVTQFVVGHRKFICNGKECEVIIVSVRGTNETNAEWSSNFDVGADTKEYYDATGKNHPDWKNKLNHKGFDVAANRVYDKLTAYINSYVDKDAQTSILITGHSRGAGIANILGQMYEDKTDYKTFAYTFAAPNTTTASNASSYKNIFNIINEDDIIPYLPLSAWGFKNYGVTKSISVKEYYGTGLLETAKEGSFKWFIGESYNDDGGRQRTIDCFAALATCREDLYKIDTTDAGKVYYRGNFSSGYSQKDATAKYNELTTAFAEQKLSKFCTVKILDYNGIWKYQVEVNYCPAFFMQMLSNMTTGVGPMLGHDITGKYNDAKLSFIASSGKVVIGGMEHPHMQPTYYLIAKNDFEAI